MEKLNLEYKGYTCAMYHNHDDRNRLYGKPCAPGSIKPLEDWDFAADTIEEAKKRFETQVDKIINNENYKKKQLEWKTFADSQSIATVINILPDVFEKRIRQKEFDISLLTSVKGGDYEVPLYYVTKAWDVLLKGTLGFLSFLIGPEEDDDFSEETLQEFIDEESILRIRSQAIEDNDRMKVLWKKYFDIDIDTLDVNFKKFDMHMPPNVSHDDCIDYFLDVPNGVSEWIFDAIKYPSDDWASFDAVSSLMEITAYVLRYERNECFDINDYCIHVVGVESDQETYSLLCSQLANDYFNIYPSAEKVDSWKMTAKERMKSLQECDVAVIMQTRNTGRSKKYQKEVLELISLGKPFVTISIKSEDVVLPGKLPFQSNIFTENKKMSIKYEDLKNDILEMLKWVYDCRSEKVWLECDLCDNEYDKAVSLYEKGMEAKENGDEATAKKFLTESAEMGLPSAMVMLAFLLHGIDDSDDSQKKQFELISQAAQYGLWPAIRTLGTLFEEGTGCKKDVDKAMSWYKIAAKEGVGCACGDISDLYDKGEYFKRNLGKALYWMGNAHAHEIDSDVNDYKEDFDRLLAELFADYD